MLASTSGEKGSRVILVFDSDMPGVKDPVRAVRSRRAVEALRTGAQRSWCATSRSTPTARRSALTTSWPPAGPSPSCA